MIAVMLARLLLSVLLLCGLFCPSTGFAAATRPEPPPSAPAQAVDQAACSAMLRNPTHDQLHDWVDAHRDKIAALITPDDRERFDGLLRAGRCEAAEVMIRERYQAGFPDMQCFFDPDTGDESVWRIFVATDAYPDLTLCFGEQELTAARAAFRRMGLAPPAARAFRTSARLKRDYGALWIDVLMLDHAAEQIVSSCFRIHPPACFAYARLADQGAIDEDDETILSILIRARLAGYETPERASLEAEVGARLSPSARASADARARRVFSGYTDALSLDE